RGRRAARRWCWIQVAASLVPLASRRAVLARRVRAERGDPMLASFAADLRYSARLARRAPLVTVSVIAAIGGGIAAATAIVSVMEGMFFQRLPFTRPAELVRISTVVERFGRAPEVNYLDANDIRQEAATLAGVAQYDVEPSTARIDADAPAMSVTMLYADPHLGALLDLHPAIGRGFVAADFADRAPAVALVTDRFWRERFGADPAAVGRPIEVGSDRARIVGILPRSADRFPAGGSDVWAPLIVSPGSFLNQRGSIALSAIARQRSDSS